MKNWLQLVAMVLLFGLPGSMKAQSALPSELELYDSLVSRGFCAPDVVWRIAVWETGHLRSGLCVNYNNLFGLKQSRSQYRHFDHWLDCLDYMQVLWNRKFEEFAESGVGGDAYYFLQWWGYKTGHSEHPSEANYIVHLKSIRLPEPYRSEPIVDPASEVAPESGAEPELEPHLEPESAPRPEPESAPGSEIEDELHEN
jgi:hypothetical protein